MCRSGCARRGLPDTRYFHLIVREPFGHPDLQIPSLLQVAQKGPDTRRSKKGTRPVGMGLSIAPDAKKSLGMEAYIEVRHNDER